MRLELVNRRYVIVVYYLNIEYKELLVVTCNLNNRNKKTSKTYKI